MFFRNELVVLVVRTGELYVSPAERPSLVGGLESGLDCGTGLWDWTQRKLR